VGRVGRRCAARGAQRRRDDATTRQYVDLAGERFTADADLLEQRLWVGSGTKNRYEVAASAPNGE